MSSIVIYLTLFLLNYISKQEISCVPTCLIVDTSLLPKSEGEISLSNNRTSSSLLRNLRMTDNSRSLTSPELLFETIPLSYIDIKSKSSTTILKKPASEQAPVRKFSPCPLSLLHDIESQMVVPFEFRRLRIEQPDHYKKFVDIDKRETVPDLSTAVYERRSDPEGVRFCRTCRDGFWTQLTVCQQVRCDAELLRANPRLVTEWGEIKPIDGGALYAPSTIYAMYAFAFGPHCKRCETNGQWSRYALPELCSGIKYFSQSTSTIIGQTTTINKKPDTTKSINKKQ